MKAIGAIGPKADAALPELILALDDRDEEIRTAAAEALGAVGSGPRERAAILPLFEALKDDDRIVREQAAKALSQIGARTEEAIPGLIEAMKKTAVPPLLVSLEDEDPVVRQHAATALGKIGASTDRVVPALIRAMKDPDRLVRLGAVRALESVGPAAERFPRRPGPPEGRHGPGRSRRPPTLRSGPSNPVRRDRREGRSG